MFPRQESIKPLGSKGAEHVQLGQIEGPCSLTVPSESIDQPQRPESPAPGGPVRRSGYRAPYPTQAQWSPAPDSMLRLPRSHSHDWVSSFLAGRTAIMAMQSTMLAM
jgi:hypothetical protein